MLFYFVLSSICTTFAPMIYPDNFENKIGFNEIRKMLRERCLSPLGKEQVDKMAFSSDAEQVNEWLMQVREFRRLMEEVEDFPLQYFYDVRESILRIRVENSHLEEDELFDLRRSLSTIADMVKILNHSDDDDEPEDGWKREKKYPYPALHRLSQDVVTFPQLIQRIDQILDKFGKIRDNATPELLQIRRELAKTEGSISRTLYSILRSAQSEGIVEKDVTPTLRDGRLVIPVIPTLKRKIKGIVHDESATGKTVFIEPTEVVEANNRVRELEGEERKEIIRILTDFTNKVRPYSKEILDSYRFLAIIDLIQAKQKLADIFKAIEPEVEDHPHIDWTRAIHPLLQLSLQKKNEKVVPLDIMLTQDKRILIISGPNAGGKSVCLKTVGLLQYMLQCGLSIPVSERSKTGVFQNIMIDIGDEQSLENDLSTYSSHLLNMKNMMKAANGETIILIDEFGTGTEPGIGGAIAEAVLDKFCKQQAYGVITTHYQNLKHFADSHEGVVNGAMLSDRRFLEGTRDVRFVYFFAFLRRRVHVIYHRRFQPAVTEIESVFVVKSFREIYRGFSVFCKFFDFRTAGIRQPQNARDFVERFADGVVLRRADDFYVIVPSNLHDCGVSARRKQAKIRRFQQFVRDIVCRNMSPDVIDLNKRHVHCVRKRFRIRYADKQRAQKPRSVRYRHCGYVGK